MNHVGPQGILGCLVDATKPVQCEIKGQSISEIGQRIGLSPLDKETIRRRYNCRGLLLRFKLIQ